MSEQLGIDDTHDPARTSWVEGSEPGGAFPIQNLPFCTFLLEGRPRMGVGIGAAVLDLQALNRTGLLGSGVGDALGGQPGDLRRLMALPAGTRRELRRRLSGVLSMGADARSTVQACLHEPSSLTFALPAQPGNFTDFFSSIHHARNAGELRRPGNPLLPNFHHLPVAYQGRASTVRVSDTDVIRPSGQVLPEGGTEPAFAPTAMLDFECELAVWLGGPTPLGQPVPLSDAWAHVFGIGLLNDWSARDIQLWESQPLGPLLSKSFLTSASPWVVTACALAPFRVPAAPRHRDAPRLLAYLDAPEDRAAGGLSVDLRVALRTPAMRARGLPAQTIATPRFKDHYWTIAQMLAHLTSNGCPLMPGDVLGTGTVSGPGRGELGCLLEINRLGRESLHLPSGETRTWLEDGDEVVIAGACSAAGYVPIGLGDVRGRVVPPHHQPHPWRDWTS
ncbi:fumarylacetoacetase [Verticiella sediminum]|uniref:fumarylacetoacetase n=1 Tax=Verticiella sediminum TaxID=1247510 RepID=A0A556AGP5_9BURK|nr:fumarylacetoacetase [Verticiella sediminum]TSH92042.1 fumarylacetoacetase [Verticiella sediminum]